MPKDSHENKGLYAYFAENPDEARRQFFEPAPGLSRRGFFAGAGLAAAGGLLGMTIPFYANMPRGLVPAAFASEDVLVGKDGLTLLNDRPINAETPAHLLDDAITPTARHFIRNNGLPPEDADAAGWTLTVDGLVETAMDLSIADLQAGFEVVTMALTIECGGNGRAFFDPPARGNQWTVGAVGCSEWTGVRLADVLKKAGVKPGAVYTAHYGADTHLSGKEGKLPISRGVPIAQGHDRQCADRVCDERRAAAQAERRARCASWCRAGRAPARRKWLKRIQLRDIVHDGPKMTGKSYRVPAYPVAPGDKVPTEDFEIIERMPVKSLVTAPAKRRRGGAGRSRCAATPGLGDRTVSAVDLSIDFGQELDGGPNWTGRSIRAPGRTGGAQSPSPRPAITRSGRGRRTARARCSPSPSTGTRKAILNNTMHRVALRVA